MYYTVDWDKAATPVAQLAQLGPEAAVTGHAIPMRGLAMRSALQTLARDFHRIAVPRNSRYQRIPARAEDGSAYCDPGT
jgi:hypothetical protein